MSSVEGMPQRTPEARWPRPFHYRGRGLSPPGNAVARPDRSANRHSRCHQMKKWPVASCGSPPAAVVADWGPIATAQRYGTPGYQTVASIRALPDRSSATTLPPPGGDEDVVALVSVPISKRETHSAARAGSNSVRPTKPAALFGIRAQDGRSLCNCPRSLRYRAVNVSENQTGPRDKFRARIFPC